MVPSFPFGTFAANISATVILGTVILIQGRERAPMKLISCNLLYGIDNGFCGCLSTISTFAVELDTLIRKHAYAYATASIAVGISIMVLMVGSSAWSEGYVSNCGL
jgi:fluoride exporter